MKKNFRKYAMIWVYLLAVASCGLASPLWADPVVRSDNRQDIFYLPVQTVHIVTETAAPNDAADNAPDIVSWRVESNTDIDGSGGIGFYRDGSDEASFLLVLEEDPHGLVVPEGSVQPNRMQASDLMIFPGFSVPCDVLPLSVCGDLLPKIFDIRRQAGDWVFIDELEVTCRLVSADEATASGWIRVSLPAAQKDLRLIRVLNRRTGEMVAQQVWGSSSSWWLYEETPHRRSWQVGSE